MHAAGEFQMPALEKEMGPADVPGDVAMSSS